MESGEVSATTVVMAAALIALAIVVFAFIGYSMDLKATWESIKKANFYMIGLGSVTMLVAHFLRGYRWNMLTETANIKLNHIPYKGANLSVEAVIAGVQAEVAAADAGWRHG